MELDVSVGESEVVTDNVAEMLALNERNRDELIDGSFDSDHDSERVSLRETDGVADAVFELFPLSLTVSEKDSKKDAVSEKDGEFEFPHETDLLGEVVALTDCENDSEGLVLEEALGDRDSESVLSPERDAEVDSLLLPVTLAELL